MRLERVDLLLHGDVGRGHDEVHPDDGADLRGIPSELLGAATDAGQPLPHGDRVGVAHEDQLGVPGGELPAARRPSGLDDDRGALRRRRHQVGPRHAEVLADVIDAMHLRGVGEDPGCLVAEERVVLPAALPQGVGDLEELVGAVVAAVVRHHVEAEVGRRARQVRRHHVPADATRGEVVERGEAARVGERVLVGGRHGRAERDPVGDGGERRDVQHRVERRDLHAVPDRRLGSTPVRVVEAEDVAEEEQVHPGVLDAACLVGPVAQRRRRQPVVRGVGPQARGRGAVADAGLLVEAEEQRAGVRHGR